MGMMKLNKAELLRIADALDRSEKARRNMCGYVAGDTGLLRAEYTLDANLKNKVQTLADSGLTFDLM